MTSSESWSKPEMQFWELLPNQWMNKAAQMAYAQDESIWEDAPQANPWINMDSSIKARSSFSAEIRQDLVAVLKEQYQGLADDAFLAYIDLLLDENTLTVTTGQQIHLMGGPWYVWYKLWSTIRLAKDLTKRFPQKKIIPIFWMATEDHDMEEIDTVQWWGKTFKWKHGYQGPSGKAPLIGIEQVITEMEDSFGDRMSALKVWPLLKEAYQNQADLAAATRYIFHHLLKEEGLICLDANHVLLKKHFKDLLKKDAGGAFTQEFRKQTLNLNEKEIGPLVNIRTIHQFYLGQGFRERIDFKEGKFVTREGRQWDDLSQEIETHPERFSPNVLLRPFYQETVLPNVAYVGGPAELVYWLQILPTLYKTTASACKWVLRESWIQLPASVKETLDKWDLNITELFGQIETIQEKLLAHQSGSIDIETPIITIEEELNKINKALFTFKYLDLKLIKKSQQDFVKSLQKELSKAKENWLQSTDIAAKMKKIEKIKLSYFDANAPQERKDFFLSGNYDFAGWSEIKLKGEGRLSSGIIIH